MSWDGVMKEYRCWKRMAQRPDEWMCLGESRLRHHAGFQDKRATRQAEFVLGDRFRFGEGQGQGQAIRQWSVGLTKGYRSK